MRTRKEQYEHGQRQEERIIELITHQARSVQEIADLMGVTRSNITKYMVRMRREGIRPFYLASHMPKLGCKPRPLYRAGDLPDVGFVPRVIRNKNRVFRSAHRRMRILEILATGMYSANEIAEKMPMSKARAREYIAAMRKDGIIHIKAWRVNHTVEALYVAGSGKDAVWVPETRQQRYARHKARQLQAKKEQARAEKEARLQWEREQRANDAQYRVTMARNEADKKAAAKKAAEVVKEATSRPHSWLSALGL